MAKVIRSYKSDDHYLLLKWFLQNQLQIVLVHNKELRNSITSDAFFKSTNKMRLEFVLQDIRRLVMYS